MGGRNSYTMNEAIVTGCNGFIGARIVCRLLEKRWRVHAVGRSKGGATWQKRVIAALDDIDGRVVNRDILSGLHCYDAELTIPGLGLHADFRDRFSADKAILFHVAGDIRFNPPDQEAQRRINVDAALHVMETFRKYIASAVHVSTAFVSGTRQETVLETDLDLGQTFHNCYEKSKLDAETAVIRQCRSMNLPLIIVRPSVIVNDTRTGRSSTFTHLNALIEVVSRLQAYYDLGPGEVVSREIRIAVNPLSRPNLAPANPIVEALLKIAEHPMAPGKTYHLCHPAPQTNTEILDLLTEAFDVKGKVALVYVNSLIKPVSRTENMIVRAFKPYLPYLNDRSQYDLTNTRSLVPEYDALFSALDKDYLMKVIRFQKT